MSQSKSKSNTEDSLTVKTRTHRLQGTRLQVKFSPSFQILSESNFEEQGDFAKIDPFCFVYFFLVQEPTTRKPR